jgi:hypothetical protein
LPQLRESVVLLVLRSAGASSRMSEVTTCWVVWFMRGSFQIVGVYTDQARAVDVAVRDRDFQITEAELRGGARVKVVA